MPRTYGTCGPVVCATRGIELPVPGAHRLDGQAIRARRTASATAPADDVDQVHEQTNAQTPVLPVRLVDQAAALPATAQAGPVVCDVCGVRVAAEYALRTGQTRHKPCQARAAGTGGRAVREVA
jgi:hypothetical protein